MLFGGVNLSRLWRDKMQDDIELIDEVSLTMRGDRRGVRYGTYFEQSQRNKRDKENKKDVNRRGLYPSPERPNEF